MRILIALSLMMLPGTTLAFPVPKAKTPSAADTTWEGTHQWSQGQGETLKITFKKDGTIVYDNGLGSHHYSGTWTQEGDTLTWTVNKHATFKASINGDKLEGTGSNVVANNATVAFKRLEVK